MKVSIRKGLRLKKFYARQCRVTAQAWMWRFIEIVETVCNKKVFVDPSSLDQLRLLNLKAWSLKYHVSEEFVVKTLVNYWSARSKKWAESRHDVKAAKMVNTIGCRIPTLAGRVSEEVLKAAITSEQVTSDKLTQQEADVNMYNDMHYKTDDVITQSDSPKSFVKKYRRMVKRETKSYAKVKTILSRRRYPNSPWY